MACTRETQTFASSTQTFGQTPTWCHVHQGNVHGVSVDHVCHCCSVHGVGHEALQRVLLTCSSRAHATLQLLLCNTCNNDTQLQYLDAPLHNLVNVDFAQHLHHALHHLIHVDLLDVLLENLYTKAVSMQRRAPSLWP
jgi:hypothetical protein